ncbi:radical SAM protein [Halarsenatibacter silvermanii]|uniref:Putative pyruvate formate lyase activating enzyme n=1 Tax=Halarsenatibacter silvermanii TaxID=321763 RepID=A0A1G9KJV4_9FIRM|nr:radical SAM protein [Halarsenatibacter silvermanii]SDL49695.1 putative pyruvate formate lyase activating enzyme [Halarsenatibacter silvermanii]
MSLQQAYKSGKLRNKVKKAYREFRNCRLCPQKCSVNRLADEIGSCGIGKFPIVSGAAPHRGEEPPLSGSSGSGTIFFSGCSLNCVYCQNYDISQKLRGNTFTIPELARTMLRLENKGCHNINLVTPSHVIYPILAALYLAAGEGLDLPVVYNSSGYDSLKALELMDGVVDIYMPDFKYGSDEAGKRYSQIEEYYSKASKAIEEMYRQVGKLTVDEKGIATSGLLIRHLVLPEGAAETKNIMEFIAKKLSADNYVNIMRQYYPSYQAGNFPELAKRPDGEDFRRAHRSARDSGIDPGTLPESI